MGGEGTPDGRGGLRKAEGSTGIGMGARRMAADKGWQSMVFGILVYTFVFETGL